MKKEGGKSDIRKRGFKKTPEKGGDLGYSS